MPLYNKAGLQSLLNNQNEETLSIIYDTYAGAIYGSICHDICDKQIANKILANVFIRFREEVKNRECISEGLFICLYRISKKMIFENCNKPGLVVKDQNVAKSFTTTPLTV